MLALKLTDIDFSYGSRKIIKVGSLSINEDEKVGLIGPNGCGKSTLLDIIAGRIDASPGSAKRYMDVSYCDQAGSPKLRPSARLLSIFKAQEGLINPSGGERMRYKLASAFTPGKGILILDEPTTNLDLDGILQLRDSIFEWEGPVLLVTHDAALLSETCERMLSIRDCKLEDFCGGYDEWISNLRLQEKSRINEYDEYLRQKRHLLGALRQAHSSAKQVKTTPSRMGNSEARLHKAEAKESSEKLAKKASAILSRLERLKAVRRPKPDRELSMAFAKPSDSLPRFAAVAREIGLNAGKRRLLETASFDLPTGSKTCLLGPNGCGKTSLLIKMAEFPEAIVAKGIKLALMRQDLTNLSGAHSALENVMMTSNRTEPFVRTVLAGLRITGDMVHTPVGAMSGGERMKVELARLMMSGADMLLLDEPSNHMDIESGGALGEVLRAWPGTLLMATHDRALIDAVSDRIIIWQGTKLLTYEGNYTDYMSFTNDKLDIAALAEEMKRAEDASKRTGPIFDTANRGNLDE